MSLESISDILAVEGLKEAADTFFGKRKSLEEEIDLFLNKSRDLARSVDRINDSVRSLHYCLLGDESSFSDFWFRLDVEYSVFSGLTPAWNSDLSLPWGLRAGQRYSALVLSVYKELYQRVDLYMNGELYDDPKIPGRKLRTANFVHLQKWCESLNKEVENVNNNYQASGMLQFARRVKQGDSGQESMRGLGNLSDLDSSISFSSIDFSSLGLAQFPEMQSPDSARDRIKEWCRQNYKTKSAEVRALLDEIGKK